MFFNFGDDAKCIEKVRAKARAKARKAKARKAKAKVRAKVRAKANIFYKNNNTNFVFHLIT
jgi:hypothetical protein